MAVSIPRISVIVPVYNDWHRVPVLLERLSRQSLPPEQFEILLIDNGSDQLQPPDQAPPNTRILHCRTPGSYAARNRGLEHARGTWLVFTDADCRPRLDWLEQLVTSAQASGSNTILAGQVRMTASDPSPGLCEIHDLVKGIPQDWYVQRGYAATANLLVPAQLARQVGGFDASRYSGGDADFCRRAVASGARLEYVQEAIVEHSARTTWVELSAKYRRIKGGQITSGSRRQRFIWIVRTFLPPVVIFHRFLGAKNWPIRYRFLALGVQLRLWGIEIIEASRLLLLGDRKR